MGKPAYPMGTHRPLLPLVVRYKYSPPPMQGPRRENSNAFISAPRPSSPACGGGHMVILSDRSLRKLGEHKNLAHYCSLGRFLRKKA